ncbi:MAG: NYN domain-containing protein [Gemmataceae bacterium]
MDRVAVFVDAGYLFAQGSVVLSGKKLTRSALQLDPEKAIAYFAELATGLSKTPLLRVYWYDGTSTGPTPQHLAVAHLSGVKLRLGFVNSVGQQKGVDSLIVTDMITLARNRAMSDAVLLSGDEDIRVGVQQAQEYGVRVHLVGIKPCHGSQSQMLMQEADSTKELDHDDLRPFLTLKPELPPVSTQTAPSPAAIQSGVNVWQEVATPLVGQLSDSELQALVATFSKSNLIPKEIDGRLLARCQARLNRVLASVEKMQLRQVFRQLCEARMKSLEVAKSASQS